jgi:MoxR-like ATPase
MSFEVREYPVEKRSFKSKVRPVMIITSNTERQLPLPFLRRCVFHNIEFPDVEKLKEIIGERLGRYNLAPELVNAAVDRFHEVRDIKGLSKKPATGELLTWLVALHQKGVDGRTLAREHLARLPLWQALLKDRGDLVRLRETPA